MTKRITFLYNSLNTTSKIGSIWRNFLINVKFIYDSLSSELVTCPQGLCARIFQAWILMLYFGLKPITYDVALMIHIKAQLNHGHSGRSKRHLGCFYCDVTQKEVQSAHQMPSLHKWEHTALIFSMIFFFCGGVAFVFLSCLHCFLGVPPLIDFKGYKTGVFQSFSAFQQRHFNCNCTVMWRVYTSTVGVWPSTSCRLMSNCCVLCEFKRKTDSEKLVSLNIPTFLSVIVLLLIKKKNSLWSMWHLSFVEVHSTKTAILLNRIQSVCRVNYFVNKGNVYIV